MTLADLERRFPLAFPCLDTCLDHTDMEHFVMRDQRAHTLRRAAAELEAILFRLVGLGDDDARYRPTVEWMELAELAGLVGGWRALLEGELPVERLP